METSEILARLRESPFVYTEAHKLRREIKMMDEDDREILVRKLRTERCKSENQQLSRAIDEMLFNMS